jgi:hypothetical protein
MLTRRSLITGAAALAGTHTLYAQPMRGAVAHLVTALDDSESMSLKGRRTSTFTALAAVMRSRQMARLVSECTYDTIQFDLLTWSEYPRRAANTITIERDDPAPALEQIAQVIDDTRDMPPLGEGTHTAWVMEMGLQLFNPRTDHDVLNLVTDDDGNRMSMADTVVQQQRAYRLDITINGLIIGNPNALNHYFRKAVATPNGFVRNAEQDESMEASWYSKFVGDLA